MQQIKNEILDIDPKKWWGDDFDVRYYLISKLVKIKTKKILDVGGGIGIILSKSDSSNTRINLDLSFNDLIICHQKNDQKIQNICGSMTHLPFKLECFDCVISGSVLQYAKNKDIQNKQYYEKNGCNEYPTVEQTLLEINRVLKKNGKLFLVTPNNAYYKSYMLKYNELKYAIENHFSEYSLFFYNTFPRLSKKYRKLNLANMIPKILSKIRNPNNIVKSLIKKDKGKGKNSVSFYVDIIKKE